MEYNKDLKSDSVKSQIVIGYYRDKKSSYELSREMEIPARTIQNFLAKDTHKLWHLENEDWVDELKMGEAKGKSFVGIGYAGTIQKVVDKVTHLENIEKAKTLYDATRGALVSGDKMIRIPSQYLEEDVSAEDAEVLDAFIKIMENLEKCQENGILFIGMSQQEITNLIESIRSGVQVFTDKEGNTLCIDEIYEDRLTFKLERDELDDYEDKVMDEIARGRESFSLSSAAVAAPKAEIDVAISTILKYMKPAKEDNSRILLISDMHIPYHHKDTIKFLQHLKDKYNPTRVICLGDELDKHALSFHDSDPDLPSAGDELRLALPVIAKLKEMFPVMDILESNHGSLVYRKAHAHGIPRHYLKTYNDVLGVDDKWKWYYDLTIELPNGNKCYFHHGKSANVSKTSQTMSMCAVQGHYHETFKVEYWGNPNGLYWGLQTGCLIDDKAYAFNYNNCNLKRPIIGTAMIIDSIPVLEPLVMDVHGNWIQK